MKEYTDSDFVIRIPGAADDLARAQKVVLYIVGKNGSFEREPVIDGELIKTSFTPQDTATLGTGYVNCEVTIKLENGKQLKTNTVGFQLQEALLDRVI